MHKFVVTVPVRLSVVVLVEAGNSEDAIRRAVSEIHVSEIAAGDGIVLEGCLVGDVELEEEKAEARDPEEGHG